MKPGSDDQRPELAASGDARGGEMVSADYWADFERKLEEALAALANTPRPER